MKILKNCLIIVLFVSGMGIMTNVFAEQSASSRLTVVAGLSNGEACYFNWKCESGAWNSNAHTCN